MRVFSALYQVIETPCRNGRAHEPESKALVQNSTPPELRDVSDNTETERIPLKSSENTGPSTNYEDTLGVLHHEDLSSSNASVSNFQSEVCIFHGRSCIFYRNQRSCHQMKRR